MVRVEDVMDELWFQPNGGLVDFLQFMYNTLDWLEGQLNEISEGGTYRTIGQ